MAEKVSSMKLKLDAEGHVVVQDGRPVYVHDDGKEVPFDALATVATITRLNGEAKGHREAKEAAEAKLKAFEGIEDGEAARKAMETVRNLKEGDLVTVGKVEEIKAAARKAAEDQVAANAKASAEQLKIMEGERDGLRNSLYAEKVGGSFSRSKFVAEKVVTPPDMLQAMFGQRFKVEDGKIVGYDASGNKLYSRAKPGELADFDEALETMVDSYAHRDSILKASGSSGAGSGTSAHRGGTGGGKTMTRTEFNSLPPLRQGEVVRGGTTITD